VTCDAAEEAARASPPAPPSDPTRSGIVSGAKSIILTPSSNDRRDGHWSSVAATLGGGRRATVDGFIIGSNSFLTMFRHPASPFRRP